MKRKHFYLLAALLAATVLTIPTACSDDSEESAESLAKKYCDCEKIEDVSKREQCYDKVNFELQFHLDDPTYMAVYNQAAQACYN